MNTLVCHPSIAKRMARAMTVLMLVGLGLVSAIKYSVTTVRMEAEQSDMLTQKSLVLAEFIQHACSQGETELLRKLALYEPVRGNTRLTLWRGDGSPLFEESARPYTHQATLKFEVPAATVAGGVVRAHLEMDTSHDQRVLRGMAITLLSTTLLGALAAGLAIHWLVRRELTPLLDLAAQTRAIAPDRLDQRLRLARPSEELVPWIDQFNALMERLQRAYVQLEGFNADVAHELRTPLATLIGETEVALSRERDNQTLRETLASNLEEMQRLSALINDMLFLAQADRGAKARRNAPLTLSTLVHEVAEFHEGALEDAGLHLAITGEASAAVDGPLVKRALSNLLSNATRFATAGSTIQVTIRNQPETPEILVTVANQGTPIDPAHLPRLFDRFFRADPSRCCDEATHHGLGLAIVSAIARMHGGTTIARSEPGVNTIGFTLAHA
jgi:two-component system heavy metal sensor histidine kinase CusS